MYIVSRDKRSIINTEQITSMYVGADGCTIKADFENGKGCQIGRYNSECECQTVIEIIAGNFGKADVFFMPEDSAVNARLNTGGRKTAPHKRKEDKGAWRFVKQKSIKNIRREFKDKGIFYTPSALAEKLKSYVDIEPESVYDPACGAGNLLGVFPGDVKNTARS